MKRLMLGIVVCVALMVGGNGCEGKLAPADMQALAAQQEVLQQQVDTVQVAVTQMMKDLAGGGIVDEETVLRIAKLNKEADKVQAQIAVIAQALEGVPLTGDTAQDFIAQLQAANTASSGFNPYVVPVGAGLSILSIFLGWLARRNSKTAAAAQVKYQAHKQGVERTMKEVSVSSNSGVKVVETQLYDNIGEARANLGV